MVVTEMIFILCFFLLMLSVFSRTEVRMPVLWSCMSR